MTLSTGESGATTEAIVPFTARRRLFRKYIALFVAVVCVALVANGLFDIAPFLLAVVVLRWQRQAKTGARLRRWGRALRPAIAPRHSALKCVGRS